MNKHTPGPWKISRQKKKKGMISMPPLIESANPRPGDGETVCSMGGGIVHFANGEANARLISAAPDLLKAAKYALGDLYTIEDGEPNEGVSESISKLLKAIAKAEGGAK